MPWRSLALVAIAVLWNVRRRNEKPHGAGGR